MPGMKNISTFEITEYLKKKKCCTVQELQKRFGVSSATIHRDIDHLARHGLVRKSWGGIALEENTVSTGEQRSVSSSFQERLNWNSAAKQRVAELAFSRIDEGDIIFLDSSTSVSWLAQKLTESHFSNLTIITNSVTVIEKFCEFPPHYVLISLGGSFDLRMNAFLGRGALRELRNLTISKAFVSAFGLCDGNVTTNHENLAMLLTEVLERAEQKYLVIDRSKLDRRGLFTFASERSFDEIITG